MQILKRYPLLLLAVISVAFVFISYQRGMRADVQGDYHIYWQTGRQFWNGEKLYTPGLVDGGFTYPPFAALFFSLFSVFPFHISAFLFTYLVNYGLWIASIFLTKKIFELFYPQNDLTWPLVLSSLLYRFLLAQLHMDECQPAGIVLNFIGYTILSAKKV